MKVYQAIAAVMADMAKDGISKDRKNQQQGYAFRGIDEFPSYLFTECGKVFSKRKNRFLIPQACGNALNYKIVTLCENGKQHRIFVHALICAAFYGPRPKGYVTNHKDLNRGNNHASNLEWVTQSENVRHAYANGARTINKAHRDRASLLGLAKRSFTEKQAIEIRSEFSGRRGQITMLARKHGLSRYAVSSIVRGAL